MFSWRQQLLRNVFSDAFRGSVAREALQTTAVYQTLHGQQLGTAEQCAGSTLTDARLLANSRTLRSGVNYRRQLARCTGRESQ